MHPLSLTLTASLHRFRRPWVVAGLISLSSANLAAAELSDRHEYDIQAGSLAAALNQFAAQTGIFLSSQSAQLSNKTTSGYQGSSSGIEALNNLLQGSGLTFQETESGDVVITSALSGDNLTLSPLLIESTREVPPAGQNTLSREEIDSMAGTTGSMTSLLQNNSSVQYSRSSNLSANAATLRPEEISIHGQASYQNAYMIDGVGTNNDLNPGNNEDSFSDPIRPTNLSMLGGSSSQSYYLDPDAISSVTVYDNNVPAEYGGFTGGVVDTELLHYQDKEYTTIKYAISGSDLNEMHVDDDTKEDYENGDNFDGSYTPDYLKQRVSLTSVQKLSERLSSGITVSRSQSDFKQTYTNNGGKGDQKNIEFQDRIDNVMGRFDYRANDRLDLGLALRYSDRTHDGITNDTFDDHFSKAHKAYGVTGETTYYGDNGTLTTKLSADRAFDQLESESSTYTSRPTPNYYEQSLYSGGYGNIRQQQDTLNLSTKWEHQTLDWGAASHNLSTGLQASQIDAFYEVEDDITNNSYSCLEGPFNDGCDDINNDGVHDANDEYLRMQYIIAANRFEKQYYTYGAFLEDSIRYGNWTVNLGVRADYETLLENLNIAPRTSVVWDAFGNKSTVVTAGANRYYGRSFLRYAINDTLRSWRTQYKYDKQGNLTGTKSYDDRSLASYDLKTPYSDELSLSIAQRMGDMRATLKGVLRDSKDGVQSTTEDNKYYYTNEGVSTHQEVSLKLETIEGFQIGNTLTHLETSISVQESKSNSQSDSAYDESYSEEPVFYDGKIMNKSDLPSWDYSIPFNFQFQTTTLIPTWDLTWTNSVNLHAGGKVAAKTSTRVEINGENPFLYEDVEFDRYATLDTTFTWTPNLVRKLDGYLQVGINNVFDKVIDVSTSSRNDNKSYTVGRSVSLEVGMRF